MRIDRITDEYNLKIVKFLLYRSIKDLEKLLECAEQIIEDGIGSAHLDEITPKKFIDREDDYYLRVRREVENNSMNVEHLFKALIEWYQSWSIDFKEFNKETAKFFFDENKLKTWTHCILNGEPELFMQLADENYQVLTQEDIVSLNLVREVKAENLTTEFEKLDIRNQIVDKYKEEQLLQYETDFYNKIKGKKLGVFMESSWNDIDIDSLYNDYQFAYVGFESAINQPRGQRDYDFIILCTQRASHGVTFKINEMYEKHKIFLCNRSNFKQVILEFKKQLMGYYYE